ncbi:hypothetical protein PR048_030846 [Dryococelus australis]|uniref:Uncharacterized protein n=1 Tax=Dryococelus australis TaxID=614101 RepID=A0ABQ9GA17_9NEOP|nr:hypothetical protein PR048_030846 [Dryococelus australis]
MLVSSGGRNFKGQSATKKTRRKKLIVKGDISLDCAIEKPWLAEVTKIQTWEMQGSLAVEVDRVTMRKNGKPAQWDMVKGDKKEAEMIQCSWCGRRRVLDFNECPARGKCVQYVGVIILQLYIERKKKTHQCHRRFGG